MQVKYQCKNHPDFITSDPVEFVEHFYSMDYEKEANQ